MSSPSHWATMGRINPRHICAARVMVVTVSVCLSIKSHLTSGASVRYENTAMYSAGNKGQKICDVFSETGPLKRSSAPSLNSHTSGHFPTVCIVRTQVFGFF